jgi:hypothetical protein
MQNICALVVAYFPDKGFPDRFRIRTGEKISANLQHVTSRFVAPQPQELLRKRHYLL